MTAAGTYPDAWQDLCRIGIIREGGSILEFNALTEDITGLEWTERDIDGKQMLAGGQVATVTAMTPESITMKMWPVTANLANTGIVQFFHAQSTDDTADPILVKNTYSKRKKYGIILLWATTLPTTAASQPAVSIASYRVQIVNAWMTSYKPSYDDKQFSCEVTFKWTPFNKAGTENKREESSAGAGTITVLPAGITTATGW